MTNQVETIKNKTKIRLNMTTALPSNDLTTDPVIHQADEVVEVDAELAE